MQLNNNHVDWNQLTEYALQDVLADWDVIEELEQLLKTFRYRVAPYAENSLALNFEIDEVAALSDALTYIVALQKSK